ncbi:hypothetical protein J7E93_06175 [Streptomyces sp. ISL-36]|uniref:hypothetical protein n=1 Tax=Streptomyces sp. ISL-36 TaxID=2819182 RepID=UPI001BE6CCC4|nr:hypothetical protein [Streptomyces sp. ISL-36]MBT2439713.1 hypothetical protein [Streptomyces sp. ISL-36]
MHGTRTTVKILVGVAVAALSGCVSVEVPPAPPASPQEISRPTQDVAPQIVEGPAREALEAALPEPPPPSASAPATAQQEERSGKGNGKGRAGARKAKERPSAPPQKRRRPGGEPPTRMEPPRNRADVCDLGERYGGWGRDSDQAKICRSTYRR